MQSIPVRTSWPSLRSFNGNKTQKISRARLLGLNVEGLKPDMIYHCDGSFSRFSAEGSKVPTNVSMLPSLRLLTWTVSTALSPLLAAYESIQTSNLRGLGEALIHRRQPTFLRPVIRFLDTATDYTTGLAYIEQFRKATLTGQ